MRSLGPFLLRPLGRRQVDRRLPHLAFPTDRIEGRSSAIKLAASTGGGPESPPGARSRLPLGRLTTANKS